MIFFLGPLETAALIRGYCDCFLELIDNPVLVYKLLAIIKDTLPEWHKYLKTRIGKIKRIILADHFPAQISPEHFEEYFFVYVKRIFNKSPNAIKLCHNVGSVFVIYHRWFKMEKNQGGENDI